MRICGARPHSTYVGAANESSILDCWRKWNQPLTGMKASRQYVGRTLQPECYSKTSASKHTLFWSRVAREADITTSPCWSSWFNRVQRFHTLFQMIIYLEAALLAIGLIIVGLRFAILWRVNAYRDRRMLAAIWILNFSSVLATCVIVGINLKIPNHSQLARALRISSCFLTTLHEVYYLYLFCEWYWRPIGRMC